jgi:hypothetical protein
VSYNNGFDMSVDGTSLEVFAMGNGKINLGWDKGPGPGREYGERSIGSVELEPEEAFRLAHALIEQALQAQREKVR